MLSLMAPILAEAADSELSAVAVERINHRVDAVDLAGEGNPHSLPRREWLRIEVAAALRTGPVGLIQVELAHATKDTLGPIPQRGHDSSAAVCATRYPFSDAAEGDMMSDATQDNDQPEQAEPQEERDTSTGQADISDEQEEEIVEEVEELISDPAPLLRKIRFDPSALSHIGEGFRAMREGLSDFFVSSDRSAGRTKDTADRVVGLIEAELNREGLSPQERLEFIKAGERMAGTVGDSEASVREANERTLGKIVGIAAGATAGVLLLGYLAKEGKLPTIDPTA